MLRPILKWMRPGAAGLVPSSLRAMARAGTRWLQRRYQTPDVVYDPILLEHTFNGFRIRANSSFADNESGVIAAPLTRANLLSEDERVLLDRECVAFYEDVSTHKLTVADFAGVPPPSRRA